MIQKTSPTYRPVPNKYRQQLIKELQWQQSSVPSNKDILIVVHDNLEITKKCINSIQRNTTDYRLLVWDNGSSNSTKEYLERVSTVFFRAETNQGFIEPTNHLLKASQSPYLILLNNDTAVSPGWSEALLGCLQANPEIGIVGYEGVMLNDKGVGNSGGFGDEIDFVAGSCMCFHRSLYETLGGFDSLNLQFAYGEDSDYCLRAQERGYKSYAMHLRYVKHKGQATISIVKNQQTAKYFDDNHDYLCNRWRDYINNHRILLRKNNDKEED